MTTIALIGLAVVGLVVLGLAVGCLIAAIIWGHLENSGVTPDQLDKIAIRLSLVALAVSLMVLAYTWSVA